MVLFVNLNLDTECCSGAMFNMTNDFKTKVLNTIT